MDLEKEKVVERIKEAKEVYGLNYSKLAREIGLQQVTIYMFVNSTYNLSKGTSNISISLCAKADDALASPADMLIYICSAAFPTGHQRTSEFPQSSIPDPS